MSGVYLHGVVATTAVVTVGNLVGIVWRHTKQPRPLNFAEHAPEFIILTTVSCIKGPTYGVLWPAFVPFALGKAVLANKEYEKTIVGKINENGLLPHFLPGHSSLKNLWIE